MQFVTCIFSFMNVLCVPKNNRVLSERNRSLQVGKVSVADEKAEASGTNGAQVENTKDAKE